MKRHCWTCGHWLIGGLCFKNGTDEKHVITEHDYVCGEWVEENTEGTITGMVSKEVKEVMKK